MGLGLSVDVEGKFLTFRKELIQLYTNFKSNLEELCKKYDVKIDFWYSPSNIPQPKLVFNGVGINADDFYNESPEVLLNLFKRNKSKGRVKKKSITPSSE